MTTPHPIMDTRLLSRQALLTLVAAAAYSTIFLLGGHHSPAIGALALVPIISLAWAFGWRAGLASALLFALLNMLLYSALGQDGPRVIAAQWPGVLGSLLFGGIAGWLSNLQRQLREQAITLTREREALLSEIRARQQAEAALTVAKEAAEAASRSKSAFLANVSHELRTPLTIIIGYSDLIALQAESRGLDSSLADIGRIQRASRHLLGLINAVLDLSKIEAGRMELRTTTLQLPELVGEVAELIEPLIHEHENTLQVTIEPSLDAIVSDPRRLRQVLLNLLGNAAKFTRRGRVSLRVRPSQTIDESGQPVRLVSFEVADTGVGIADSDMARLFEPFSQGSAALQSGQEGSGLGLALSRSFCRLLGGDMRLTSVPGEGTTVSFTIRRDAAPGVPEQADVMV